jgi:hypothetical protein
MLKNPDNLIDTYWVMDLSDVLSKSRPAWRNASRKHSMHPAVVDAFRITNPKNWQDVVLEWPHPSVEESGKLAYYRDERSLEANRSTRTTIVRYLNKHWGGRIPDHELARLGARYQTTGFTFIRTLDEMVNAVKHGPYSCMQCFPESTHPYRVYDPSLGWHMCIKKDGETITSRAVCYDNGREKYFVRAYGDITRCQEFLVAQGYEHREGWDDAQLAAIDHPDGGWVMPYLDGFPGTVDLHGDHFVVCRNGEYAAQTTQGTVGSTPTRECSHCGENHDEDAGFYVGYHAEEWVGNCCEDEYTYVTGYRRGYDRNYYVTNDDVVNVDGENYDSEYLPRYIVQLDDGDYCHEDNAIQCAASDSYYRVDDDEVHYCEDTEDHRHEDHCWQCEATAKWYSDDEQYVEVNGDKYHPDDAPEADDVVLSECRDVIVVSEPVCLHASTFESVQLDNTIEWMTRPTIRQRPSLMDLFCKAANIPDQQTVELRNQHFADIRGWDRPMRVDVLYQPHINNPPSVVRIQEAT